VIRDFPIRDVRLYTVSKLATELQPNRTSRSAGKISAVAWTPAQDIAVDDWIRAGQRLGAMTRCSQWWLGDWVRYGTGRWGEKYKEASRITGYDVHSLRNIAYVAGRIDPSRRRDNLTWSHHAEVSALAPGEQDVWLTMASDERMSVSDLRIELRAAGRRNGTSKTLPRRRHGIDGRVTCPECSHEFEIKDL
jgi:hypothetical protein